MSASVFRNYAALFFTSLAAFLVGLTAFNFITNTQIIDAVVVPINPPFTICKDSKIVKPGDVVCYIVHYYKYADIPGDVSKQLIIKPKDGGMEAYIPLGDTAGHLPVGEVQKKGYARLPEWTPEGEAVIKLSASHHIGNRPYVSIVFTEKFEVKK